MGRKAVPKGAVRTGAQEMIGHVKEVFQDAMTEDPEEVSAAPTPAGEMID